MDKPTAPTALGERFWSKVAKQPNGCWLWTASVDSKGYGQFTMGPKAARKNVRAHRLAYLTLVGPVPEGLELDHLCRTPRCINPEHLEPVTHAENVRRGRSAEALAPFRAALRAITHCPHGHAYDEANTYRRANGARSCRACHRERQRRRKRAALEVGSSV